MDKTTRTELENLSQRLWAKSDQAKRKYAEANWKLLEGLGKLPEHSASKIMWDKEILWTQYKENSYAHQELDKILLKGEQNGTN